MYKRNELSNLTKSQEDFVKIYSDEIIKSQLTYFDKVKKECMEAYADCCYINNEIVNKDDCYKRRNLHFRSKYLMGDHLADIVKEAIPDGYNNFNHDRAVEIADYFPDCEFQLGRENSVAIYIHHVEPNMLETFTPTFEADEYHYDKKKKTIRYWWD